ncbi:DUF4231 domain-containing protein [Actinoplanes sp. NPDC051343]|uniref:DUF4231 domain-containing protein n=1 Tax=Actinoplanes sp. NPDC051343 TaxID=3363906 RepID=UPI0037A9A274
MTAPRSAGTSNSGSIDSIQRLVETSLSESISWYQNHKKWPRRFHRISTMLLIVSGATIPILSAASVSWARVTVAGLGVAVTALAGLSASYRWDRTWQVFSDAQFELEDLASRWELQKTYLLGSELEPRVVLDSLQRLATEITNEARHVRAAERGSFFGASRDEEMNSAGP